jgi:hypothetical protein
MTTEKFDYKLPTIESSIEGFKKWPQTGINLDVLAEGIKSGKLTPEQQTELNDTFTKGYNQALHACFPRDAFDILRGQNMIADNIPPQEHLDLDNEWKEINQVTKFGISQNDITTEDAFKHFKQFRREDFPDYEAISQKISLYISECIRRAHEENNHELFEKIIPAFKILAYFHKLHEKNHYWCQSEFDEIVRFSTDPEKLEFKYLRKEDVKEKFFDDATTIKS